MGKRQSSGLLALVLFGVFWLFKKTNQPTTKNPTFLKEGLLLLPLSFCSCSVWKVLLQLTLVTGKRASSSQQNKGAVSSFFIPEFLGKRFLQGGCWGRQEPGPRGNPWQ